jgi:tetratricopeptide (TPR) repeat protein
VKFLLPAAFALLASFASAQSVSTPTASLYDIGDSLRRQGRPKEAKEAFAQLLDQDPKSGGALEGLTLSCLALRQNDEALEYARRWEAQSSSSAYILGMEATALHRERRENKELPINRRIVEIDPCDVRAQRHLDEEMRLLRDGFFGAARIYKSIGPEELNTPNPQRIVYAGRSGEVRFRRFLSPTLYLVGGISMDEQIQANDTGGFTYFDILEQVYSFGLEGRPNRNTAWQAEYGQSLLHDVKGFGVGRTDFSRVKLAVQRHEWDWDFGATALRQPKYLRGAGGLNYFSLLREDDLRVQAEGPALTMQWLAKAGVSDFSEHTTYKDASLTGTKEYGNELLQPNVFHSEVEHPGAGPNGKLGYVVTDGGGLRWRRLIEDTYRLSASGSYASYRDGNHEADLSAEATAWLPWLKDKCGSAPLYASYKFDAAAYRIPSPDYRSTDYHSHTLGAYWRQGWGGTWTTLGYEHSFWVDGSRGAYQGNAALVEFEAYRRGSLSVTGNGRVGSSTVHDQSYSAGLTGRYSY